MNRGKLKAAIASVILLYATGISASTPKESKTRYYRHEVNVFVANTYSPTRWSNSYEKSVMDKLGVIGTGHSMIEDKKNPTINQDRNPRGISYYYHFNQEIAVGALSEIFTIWDTLESPNTQGDKVEVKGSAFMLMPSFKYSYLNNRWCSLYSKAYAGVYYQNLHLESTKLSESLLSDFRQNHISFAYMVTLFGWEIGKQKVRWFTELSIGTNSTLQMGLTYRFTRMK